MNTYPFKYSRNTSGKLLICNSFDDCANELELEIVKVVCIYDIAFQNEAFDIIKRIKVFPPFKDIRDFQIQNDFYLEHINDSKVCILVLGNYQLIQETLSKTDILPSDTSLVIIPTTLHAQINLCDTTHLKEMVSSQFVSAYVVLFASLLLEMDQASFNSQFSYVYRLSLMCDAALFSWLILNIYEIRERESDTIINMLQTLPNTFNKLRRKAKQNDIDDPFNFALIVSDALYKELGNSTTYSECLSLGCIITAYISYKKGLLAMEEYYEIRDMYVLFGFPISYTDSNAEKILNKIIFNDKDELKLTLLTKIGCLTTERVTKDEVMNGLEELYYSEEDNE